MSTLSAAPTWSTTRLPFQPLGSSNVPLVDAGRVHVRDVRRQVRVGHLDVGVVGLVVGALQRPGAGDRDVPPAVAGHDRGAAQELEPPGAIELEPVGVGDAVHREPPDARQLGIVPGCAHGASVGSPRVACPDVRVGLGLDRE